MKKKIIAVMLLSLCIVCISLFAAGCGDNGAELEAQIAELTERNEQLEEENEQLQGSNGDIQGQLEELRQQFEELSASNALTEEQFEELQKKFEKLLKVDWLWEEGYSLNELLVYVKPEYADNVYQIDDFYPIELSEVKQSEFIDSLYVLTLENLGVQYLADVVPKLYCFEFVDNVLLNTYNFGA